MARIGEKRVSEVLDYRRDIKGKRLIRLSAGVCSGKNQWIVQIAKSEPDLRILIVTSRKNTVIAQAEKLNAGTFLDLDKLIDEDLWGKPSAFAYKRVVCTNAGIEKFFKKCFNPKDERSHLWRKFNLVVIDEVHSLTMDATFTDCFYSEQLIKAIYNNNAEVDIVLMSGTQEPIDWLFKGKIENKVHRLNCFNECLHLEPDYVRLIPDAMAVNQMFHLWKRGGRMIYFVNHRETAARLTKSLLLMGVPEEAFGYSFNNPKEVAGKFPSTIADTLETKVENMNMQLTTKEMVPEDVKILFSTTKNKEGISILDDDIKTIFAESHIKSELIQMAGRVRGNAETGSGIETLAIIYDAQQHPINYDELEAMLNFDSLPAINETVEKYKRRCEKRGKKVDMDAVIGKVCGKNKYIRYDYATEKFKLYRGKIEGEKQSMHDVCEFKDIVKNYNKPLLSYNRTGSEVLEQEWFKWSEIVMYIAPGGVVKYAKTMLLEFLKENGLYNTVFKKDKKETIKEEINRIATIYGYKELGIKKNFKNLGTVLLKFQLKLDDVSNGVSYRIRELEESEKM